MKKLFIQDAVLCIVLVMLCLSVQSCFLTGNKSDEINKKLEGKTKSKVEELKKETEEEANPQASPKEALNNDFSRMWIIWLLSGVAGAGCIAVGVFLEKSTGSGESLVQTGLALLGIALCGPVAVFVLKITTIILYWAAITGAVLASAFAIYKLYCFVKKEQKIKRQLVKSFEVQKNLSWPSSKSKVRAEQDEETQEAVDRIRKEVGLT